MTHLLAFLGVAAIVIVTPGQDTALTIRNALLGGRSAGVATAGGVATGQLAWVLLTAAGIAALLRASEPAFLAIRIAGALYLVALGVRALVSAWRGSSEHGSSSGVAAHALRAVQAYRQGLISNLGNAKMAVFFLSVLPQFTAGRSVFAATVALGLLFCGMTLAWLSGYAVAVARAGDVLRRARIRRVLDGLTGAVLVAFGGRLLAQHR